jgi:hypothetical protein
MDNKNKDKKNSVPKARTDRGTYEKEKNSDRNRWKQNLKNYMHSKEHEDSEDFEEFE